MNNIFLSIGPINIYWYSICILLAFVTGYFLALRELKKHNISLDFFYDYFFYMIPIVLVDARIYYVIFEWGYYSKNLLEIFAVWNGGLAIHGGIIAGVIFTIIYTRKHQVDAFKLMDIVAPCLIIGQAIGRWGNFFNQEVYGQEISLEMLKSLHIPQFIIDGMYIGGTYYHPLFLYESLLCLLGFIILILVRKYRKLKVGQITALYLIIYGVIRFFMEDMRQVEYNLMFGQFKVAQLVSLILVIIGSILFIKQMNSKKLYNSKEK